MIGPKAIIKCKNCQHQFAGNYCNNCGEKVYSEHDKSLSHLFEEGLHFITHFEGKFFTTLKTILARPGQLSLDYCNGIRKKYFKPLSFFLLLVVLYLIFPLFRGLNMLLDHHMVHYLYGDYATQKVQQIMAAKQINYTTLQDNYHAASAKVSKFLLFIFIPLQALLFLCIMKRKQKPFFDHLIFSTEFNAFYILAGFLLFPLILKFIYLITRSLGVYLPSPNDYFLSISLHSVSALYLTIAIKKFYSTNIWIATLWSIVFISIHYWIFKPIYNFILFFISINLV